MKSKANIVDVARFACQNIHGRSRRKRWATMRELLVKLAVYHGYVESDLTWNMIPELKHDIADEAKAKAILANRDTDHRTLDQNDTHLNTDELGKFTRALTGFRSGSESASMLLYLGFTLQTLCRPHQLFSLKRFQVRLYSPEGMYQVPDAGPLQLIQLGDRGHHKVNNSGATTHWIVGHMQPSMLDPVTALALKVMHDAQQISIHHGRGDIISAMHSRKKGW